MKIAYSLLKIAKSMRKKIYNRIEEGQKTKNQENLKQMS